MPELTWEPTGGHRLACGKEQPVPATEAQAPDRRRALQISAASAAFGIGGALAATRIRPPLRDGMPS